MAGSTSDLRNGAILKYNNVLCTVLDYEHRTPGKGPASYQAKLRNLQTGKLIEARFRSGESIDFVRVERHPYEYLYKDGEDYIFMDMNNFDQIPLNSEMVGDEMKLIKENQQVDLLFVDENVLSCEVPAAVTLRITHTEPGFKGDTATNVMKPATVETGATVQVPLFINEGDLIKINTKTASYSERVNE
ncbi:MAG: elongation factor P [Candidatus Kapabacteria bacterium]|jgi:elongation factor P|nr:elongation factor P [Candidatus Kapabacteria bacterium]